MATPAIYEPLHPPDYWLEKARQHEAKGENDLARLCLSAADSSLYRQQREIDEERRRINDGSNAK